MMPLLLSSEAHHPMDLATPGGGGGTPVMQPQHPRPSASASSVDNSQGETLHQNGGLIGNSVTTHTYLFVFNPLKKMNLYFFPSMSEVEILWVLFGE